MKNLANEKAQKKQRPAADGRKRYFFWLLKQAGYDPAERELWHSDLRIDSLKTISAVELERVIYSLKRAIDGKPAKQAGSEEEKRERFESWRDAFFPAGVLAFGASREQREISKKQQDFIIVHALKIFGSKGNFRKWLLNWIGCEVFSLREQATAACRGLAEMAAREGLDPAPPEQSLKRPDWEQRHKGRKDV